MPDAKRGQRIVAFRVVRGDQDYDDVVATAHANVGRAFSPSVHVVPGLPKKAHYQRLRDPVSQRDWDDAHLINAARRAPR